MNLTPNLQFGWVSFGFILHDGIISIGPSQLSRLCIHFSGAFLELGQAWESFVTPTHASIGLWSSWTVLFRGPFKHFPCEGIQSGECLAEFKGV